MELVILMGIPGSGKSTLTKNISGKVVSTDSLRGYLFGNESIVQHDELVFKMAKEITAYYLKQGWTVIFDATNTKIERRKEIINIAKRFRAKVKLVWVDCPIEIALVRNASRDRKVPKEIIQSISKGLEPPMLEEGIDEIEIRNEIMEIKGTIIKG